ncbi:MAG: hypothetical protein J6Y39_07105, partial [Bacteroidaceae bacterium]|nr:hypothetical protein [Bacteroidaceae bacterium]
ELNEKTKLDDEQSKDIKRLVVLLEAKDELDKNQTMQIDSLNKTISEYNDHVRRYKKYIVLISVISIASIILSVLQFFI